MSTIQQAREILGEDAVGMTDAQIQECLALVEALADIIIVEYEAQSRMAEPSALRAAA